MSSFQGAGHDPIFWLHHCNIDRLWELWLASGVGRVNPSDAVWLTTSFNFYDETGATVSLTGAQIVDTACQLHYQYESDICGRLHADEHGWWRRYSRMGATPSAMLARLDSLETRPLRPQSQPIAQSQDTVRLGSSVVRITLPISEEGKRILSALPRDADVGGRINLVFEDIHVEGTPRVAYEIFIDLPQEVPIPMYTSSHYAGNVNLFGPAPGAEHPQKAEPQVVPLSLVFLRLSEAKRWSLDSVSVTFVPRGLTEGQNPARILRQSIQVTIGRVTLQVQ
jgi:tyrosinase